MTPEDPARPAQDGLEAFASLAAHQLGEAVALMRGAAAVLEGQRTRLDPGAQDALRALNAGGERAQRYVDDLLDVARAGTAVETPVAAELDAALDGALAELEPVLRRAPVDVQREPLPPAALDPLEAQRLFVHLLRSAMSGGATKMLFAAEAVGGAVVLRVHDDGGPIGDAPFEPFAPPRGRGPLVGAGVSLPVCARIVQRRGGAAAHERRPDGATVITLRIPAVA
jgi:signal transduction histidine kinase